ncbi:unnamed protein product, partial [Rotaria magnacalcarata]
MQSSRGKYQLLFDGFRYRTANNSQNSCRKHQSIYQSIYDLKTEQHANIIFAEKAGAGTIKIVQRVLYEEIDEQLQNLVATFNIYPQKEYFKKVRAGCG